MFLSRRNTIYPINHLSPQKANLTAWWPASKSPSSGLIRETVRGLDATLMSTAAWRGDPLLGQSVYFDGNTAEVDTLHNYSLPNVITLCAWVRPDFTNGTGNQASAIIVRKNRNVGTNQPYFSIGTDNSSPAKVQIIILGSSLTSNYTISTGIAFHVAATWAQPPELCKIYINGILDNSSSINQNIVSTTEIISFGKSFFSLPSDERWLGLIGDVRLYGAIKTAPEIYAMWHPTTRWELYDQPYQGIYPGVAAAVAASRIYQPQVMIVNS